MPLSRAGQFRRAEETAASRTVGDEDGRVIGSVLEVEKQIPV
jgi:hypothetical protein